MNPGAAWLPPDMIAGAVLAVPGVAALHPGPFGEVATHLPGRRVPGIRETGTETDDGTGTGPGIGPGTGAALEVHLVLWWGRPVLPTAEAVRRSLTALGASRVDVIVEDVALPEVVIPAAGAGAVVPDAISAGPAAPTGQRTSPRAPVEDLP